MGIACNDLGASSADELVGQADAAMYQAKREGGGRVVLFQPLDSRTEA